mgnify:CR=1 FL=1|jgi:hypothetical protein|tara:strand:+ start:228 stop:479 length:252 start_codon:yes stop_codon:yes gene_type:complete
MINKKYIYLSGVFLFLIIIKFINPSKIQKILFISYGLFKKIFNRDEVKKLPLLILMKKVYLKLVNLFGAERMLMLLELNFNYK